MVGFKNAIAGIPNEADHFDYHHQATIHIVPQEDVLGLARLSTYLSHVNILESSLEIGKGGPGV